MLKNKGKIIMISFTLAIAFGALTTEVNTSCCAVSGSIKRTRYVFGVKASQEVEKSGLEIVLTKNNILVKNQWRVTEKFSILRSFMGEFGHGKAPVVYQVHDVNAEDLSEAVRRIGAQKVYQTFKHGTKEEKNQMVEQLME